MRFSNSRANGQHLYSQFWGEVKFAEKQSDNTQGINADVVICSSFVGEASVVEVSSDEWKNAIDTAIEKINEPG